MRRAWLAICAFVCVGCHSPTPPVSISLTREETHGFSPAYRVTLHGDGTVSYFGEKYVRVHGARERHINAQIVRKLAKEFEAAGYFGWNDDYRTIIRDVASAKLDVTVGTSKKVIRDGDPGSDGGYPREAAVRAKLARLEQMVDDAAGTAEWVPCPAGLYGRICPP
jgi:hypothetical protein